jgi:hypothetical protein
MSQSRASGFSLPIVSIVVVSLSKISHHKFLCEGAIAPLGFFDPLGFCKERSLEGVKRFREGASWNLIGRRLYLLI